MSDHNDDRKVKDLLDAGTRADLERWFGLPSFEQLAERGVVPERPAQEDPEFAAVRKRQEQALAAVDPALLEAHRRRVEPDALVKPLPPLELHVDPGIARFDPARLQAGGIAEPREVERPSDLEDDLRACTPQALLRDLHRPEFEFYKMFERVDLVDGFRVDIAATITEVMSTSLKLPHAEASPFEAARALLLELRDERQKPWANLELTRERVTE